jgi:hypothetical protein
MRPGNFLLPGGPSRSANGNFGFDPTHPSAQFLLGYMLARRPERRKLSESHLIFGARSVPEAHLAAALVFDSTGAVERAREELELDREATRRRPAK